VGLCKRQDRSDLRSRRDRRKARLLSRLKIKIAIRAWIYLLIASMFEIVWTFSLKLMSVKKLRAIQWRGALSQSSTWVVLAPFAGYIVFGIGNIVFFSMAMKEIPASTALAVWMGTALIGVKLVELFFFKGSFDVYQFIYMGFILIGIVGLKRNP
jgi:quaternary ammonium compound-resistance protein SugE